MQWFQASPNHSNVGTQGAFVYLGTLKVLPTETMLPGFPPKLRNRPRMFRNNSLSAGWSYRPQTHQAGLPEAQGVHPKTQRLSKFARVKKGGSRFLCALGGPTGPLGLEPQRTGRVLWDTGRYRLYHCRISASLLTTSNPPCHVPKGKHWRCTRWRFGRPNTGGSAHLSIGWRITHGEN